MAKKESMQKKKNLTNTIIRTTIKVGVALAIIIFLYLIYDKEVFTTAGSYNAKTSNYNDSTPHELKWFGDFKGVENVPSKNQKKETSNGSQNFLQYESNK